MYINQCVKKSIMPPTSYESHIISYECVNRKGELAGEHVSDMEHEGTVANGHMSMQPLT